MRSRLQTTVVVLVGLAVLFGGACTPKVGDGCARNADCGTQRICDTSMPGGYCTTTPCLRNDCADEAVCITFDDGQSYCMKHCGGNGDCRTGDGYTCIDDFGDFPFCGIAAVPAS